MCSTRRSTKWSDPARFVVAGTSDAVLMVDSEQVLTKDIMLGCRDVSGTGNFQPGIKADLSISPKGREVSRAPRFRTID